MSERPKTETDSGAESGVSSADFSAGAIERAVLKKAVSHPLTKLPFAVCVVAVAYLAAIDVSATALTIAFLGGFTSIASLIWQYFVRGETIAAAHVAALREQWHDATSTHAEALKNKFIGQDFKDGSGVIRKLCVAYLRLVKFFEEHEDMRTGGAQDNLRRFRALADDTYRQGIKNLAAAFDIFRALQPVRQTMSKIQREIEQWKTVSQTLDPESAEAKKIAQRIDMHEKRLRVYNEHAELMQELLAKSEELEYALANAHIQLAAEASDPTLFIGSRSSTTELERQLDAARKVEERLRNLGKHEDDRLYEEIHRAGKDGGGNAR